MIINIPKISDQRIIVGLDYVVFALDTFLIGQFIDQTHFLPNNWEHPIYIDDVTNAEILTLNKLEVPSVHHIIDTFILLFKEKIKNNKKRASLVYKYMLIKALKESVPKITYIEISKALYKCGFTKNKSYATKIETTYNSVSICMDNISHHTSIIYGYKEAKGLIEYMGLEKDYNTFIDKVFTP